MILKVQDMQSGEIENISVMGESDISPDNSRLVGVLTSDEDCLFGKYLDAGYWNELFENEGLDAVQSNCVWHNELADDPGAYAEEECAETDAQMINEYPYNMFFDYEKFGEWLLQNETNQGILFEVNGNYYGIN